MVKKYSCKECEECLDSVLHFWVNSLPEKLEKHAIYFVKQGQNILMYVTNVKGKAFLVSGGGGTGITLTSPNGTIDITNGSQIDVSETVLGTIVTLHNSFEDLQGGLLNQYYHLTQAEHTYLTEVVQNDSIGALEDAINMLATPPTYFPPTSSLNNITATYEVGSSQNISITQTFVQNDGGAKISETITKNNSVVSTTNTYSETLTVPLGATNYAGTVTYGQGDCKTNNIGIIDCNGRIEAGTVASPTRTITGIYPVFSYKSSSPITAASMVTAIQSGLATKYLVQSTGTFAINYAPNQEYVAVAYPASSTTKTKWQVSALDSGNIPGGVFGAVNTLSVNSPNLFWNGIQYKIHVTPLLTNPSAPTIQLLNS